MAFAIMNTVWYHMDLLTPASALQAFINNVLRDILGSEPC